MPAALLIAWMLDASFGEPPNAVHPVAWLGRLLGPLGRRLSAWRRVPALIGGALAWGLIATALGLGAHAVEGAFAALPPAVGVLLLALVLKPCFAWRMLRDEVRAVEQALAQSLGAGRERVSHLASRDVSAMDADGVRETAIETLAENLNDSVVAPLFWFAVAGLPGAVVYRFANTADAMWGYRGRYEWAGKWAARADDLLSWLPARLTALLLAPGWRKLRRLRAEAGRTPSPNGGWPMGAMALRLGVRLRKPGVYALNADAPSPSAAGTATALRLAARAAWLAMAVAVVACAGRTL
ncbi:MAG TPA: adenosylcobinamide-phosphate synthase CbiB [Methylibium sp.]|nr:adenosylcobinamide-phosphate synthase CbiB [Methylibium sp.]